MTNTVVKIIDSNKRVVYKLVGDAAEARTLKIDAGKLNFALNTTNIIDTTGTDRKATYGLDLKRITYDVKGSSIELSTSGDASVNTFLILYGAGTMALDEGTNPMYINVSAVANSTGNVFLQSIGGAPTGVSNSYSIILDFRKNPAHYDQIGRAHV